ncbi:hypothetical protein BS78_10G223500 [Paspalum vaginatum]|nr:hypothetical protein BS78_10G223500 [Paspalum vaginatum]
MCRCAAAIARAVVAFLDAVLLGCLLSCFGARPRPGSGSGIRDAPVHRDRAAEVLRDDERGRSGTSEEDFAESAGIDEELRREANYLKLCGTISETPAELRNESYESNLENPNKCDNKSTSGPESNCELVCEANSPEGCEEHHALKSGLKNEDAQHPAGVELVAHSTFSENSPFQNFHHNMIDHSGSPFPTPLILRDDMQTPGTVYTSHGGTSISRKHVRTRKQFIYPVLRPIENRLQQMELAEDSSPLLSSNPPKRRNLEEDSIKKPAHSVVKSELPETPLSFFATDGNASHQEVLSPVELLDGRELPKSNFDEKNAWSLSHWLKSSSADAENRGDESYDEGTFITERPVFITSDLNWDVENPTPRLPKAWDGNGIPNTTTRYKEDQRVSWHTTPFEERLLKELSHEERCPSRRAVRGKLFHLEEKTE